MTRKKHPPIEIGDTFGRLTVLREWGRDKRSIRKWMCRCSCGRFAVVTSSNLNRAITQSCGCLNRERSAERQRTHGMIGTPTYNSWQSMLQRCNYPNSKSYADYGGRGVKVCDRWDPRKGGSFQNFLSDLGEKPGNDFSLDKDVLGNGMLYSKEMCMWATRVEQCNSRRSSRILEFNGERKTVAQWGRDLGMSKTTLLARLKSGWSVERALTEPVHTKFSRKKSSAPDSN